MPGSGSGYQYERCAVCEESDESEEEGSKLKFPDLPVWLTSSPWGILGEVKDIMREKEANPDPKLGESGGRLTMFDISGPVVHLLWIATLILWPFLAFLPVLAFSFTECHGWAMPRYKLFVWLCSFPFFLVVLLIELRAFTYTVIPIMQWLPNLSVMGVTLTKRWCGLWLRVTTGHMLESPADTFLH